MPASLGMLVQAFAVSIYPMLAPNSSWRVVVIAMMANGVGSDFFLPSNSSAVIANSKQEIYGVASRLLSMFANIGSTASIAVTIVGGRNVDTTQSRIRNNHKSDHSVLLYCERVRRGAPHRLLSLDWA
ncbi:MAG TPA: hypothetical protein VFF30_15375 [Nitrososphaerales archaeon]|nr:hypothetical protein [Nitrososphaerales archaeon]